MTAHKKHGRPLDRQHGQIELAHGAGGRAMAQLIEELFFPHLENPFLAQGDDGACLGALGPGQLVMSTDAHVVSPLFFPGGDIGCLAVHGTLNDVAMMGARPLYLSASFILEEGFLLADLERIIKSMGQAAREAGVAIVAADTKVVERGKGDGVFISTTGVGLLPPGRAVSGRRAQPGDAIIVSGSVGDHGMAIMAQREHLGFDAPILSDTAAVHELVEALFSSGGRLHVLRDPTRGGLACTLNEVAQQSGLGMMLNEAAIPVRPAVRAACELLGLDPLHIANEGKLVAIGPWEDAPLLLAALQAHPLGREAAIIGQTTEDPRAFVQMKTELGGYRMIDWLFAEPLPRIC